MQITTKGKDDRAVQVETNFGSTIDEALEIFGEEVVFSRFKASAVLAAQGYIRTLLNAENENGSFKHEEDEIIAKFADWKLGVKKVAASPIEKVIANITKIEDEAERAEAIKKLQEQLAGLGS